MRARGRLPKKPIEPFMLVKQVAYLLYSADIGNSNEEALD